MAARMASSARTEQWILTGGRASSLTMSGLVMVRASATVLPLTHSVARELEAMAEPQPNVLNLAFSMTWVSGLTLIWRRITSPHSGAPTRPVPTSDELLSRVPTLRGCSSWLSTLSLYAMMFSPWFVALLLDDKNRYFGS